jgi:hypothetical protein
MPVLEMHVLEIHVLEMPALEMPALEMPALEMPALEMPVRTHTRPVREYGHRSIPRLRQTVFIVVRLTPNERAASVRRIPKSTVRASSVRSTSSCSSRFRSHVLRLAFWPRRRRGSRRGT